MSDCFRKINKSTDIMVSFLGELCKRPAVGPMSGGDGEKVRADFLLSEFDRFKPTDVDVVRVPDNRVPSGYRPNIIATWKGRNKELARLIFLLHLDSVPPGDIRLWGQDPFHIVKKGNQVSGLGVEDNGQSIVASLFAAKYTAECSEYIPRETLVLLLADEEEGSEKGVQDLLSRDFFREDDILIVPDGGIPSGELIEVAEKGRVLLKIRTQGFQSHAGRTEMGYNATEAGSRIMCKILDTLRTKYTLKNEFFSPPNSTFQVTRREGNQVSMNMVAAEDIFYLDCRLLPNINPEDMLHVVRDIIDQNASQTGIPVELEVLRRESATSNAEHNAGCVQELKTALRLSLKIKGRCGGSGSGSAATFLRRKGFNAAVWCKKEQTAHQANEYILINNMLAEAKVFATLMLVDPSTNFYDDC